VGNDLYDLPLYCDIAFGWGLSKEADFLIRAIKWHGRKKGELGRLLEPACGTGRMLRAIARRGISSTGYDLNRPSVDFARQEAHRLGLGELIEVTVDDMAAAEVGGGPFDGAFNLVGSISYLRQDRQLEEHLERTAAALSPGSVYVVQQTLTDPARSDHEPQHWAGERGQVRVDFTWGRRKQDFEARLNLDYSVLDVHDGDVHEVFEQEHPLRMWSRDDLFGVVVDSGFRLVAVYDGHQTEVPTDSPDLEGLHVPYFVLRRR